MTGDDQRWVTVTDAAALLGKSERTIRRWVADNKLEVDKSETPYLVNVTGMIPAHAGPSDQGDIAALKAEIKALKAQIEGLETLIDELRGQRDYLRQVIAASLTQSQKLLEAKTGRSWLDRLFPWRNRGGQ